MLVWDIFLNQQVLSQGISATIPKRLSLTHFCLPSHTQSTTLIFKRLEQGASALDLLMRKSPSRIDFLLHTPICAGDGVAFVFPKPNCMRKRVAYILQK